jgi:DNA-binding NarL/FixJ family response regulator
VIILSASANEGDIARAYALHANGFLVKPADTSVTADMCRALKHYWFGHNRLPRDNLV